MGLERILVDGVDATVEIRGPEVSRAVSSVAANPAVRSELVSRQREWAHRRGGGVLEGRDIGTVVFPDAELKIYLTADPAERAKRRAKEVTDLDYATVAADIARRDAIDSSRSADPLQEAGDAVVDIILCNVDKYYRNFSSYAAGRMKYYLGINGGDTCAHPTTTPASPLHLPCISWQWSGTHLGPYHMVDDNGHYTDLPASGQLQGWNLSLIHI